MFSPLTEVNLPLPPQKTFRRVYIGFTILKNQNFDEMCLKNSYGPGRRFKCDEPRVVKSKVETRDFKILQTKRKRKLFKI